MSIIDRLLELQERDCAIREIKRELKDIPVRQKEEETRLDGHKAALEEIEEVQKGKQAAVKDVELEIQSRHEQIGKLRQQQLEIKTNEAFKAIETEVAGIEKDISGLEEKQLALMDEIETVGSEVNEKKSALDEENSAVETDKKVHGERASELENELKALESTREELAKDVDDMWLSRYNSVIERKGRALVPVENGVCGGCHMKLPPAVVHSASARNAMVSCDHCGRLLY